MNTYSHIFTLPSFASQDDFEEEIIPRLTTAWQNQYMQGRSGSDIVEVWFNEALDAVVPGATVREIKLSYLFDVAYSRLIAAWAVSQGKNAFSRERDKTRMKQSPRSGGQFYDRGHAIAHLIGARTDINLVPQLSKTNQGYYQFKELERNAFTSPGSLYFSYWIYEKNSISQTPVATEQGLMRPGFPLDVRYFAN